MSEDTGYKVHGVGPNEGTIYIDLPHPVNVLVGENGAGKTLAMQAICRASGDPDAEVVKNRDADAAWVEGPGVVLKTGGRRVTVRGQGDDLADYGQIHELLDPPGKTPKTRDKNRAAALLGFYREPVTQEAILALVGGDERVAGGVQGELASSGGVMGPGGVIAANLGTVAKKAKQFIEILARNRESEVLEHKATADVAKKREKEIRADLAGYDRPEADAETLAEEVAERQTELGGLDVERKVRAAKEEEREKAKAMQDAERPDVPEAMWVLKNCQEETVRLRDELANAEALYRQSVTAYEATKEQADGWDARQAILAEPIEGSTAEEVEEAERELSSRMADLEAARLYEEMDRQTLAREDAASKQDIEAEKALELRDRAKGVLREVNKILRRADFGGLMLDEEMGLAYAGPETEGVVVPFEELSEGQRARAVLLGIGVARYPDKMIPVSRAWFWSLQPARMRELVKLAAAEGIRFVTELPTDQPGIEVVGLGTDWLKTTMRAELWVDPAGRGTDRLPSGVA